MFSTSATETYGYEGSAGLTGNLTRMSGLPATVWDSDGRLKATANSASTLRFPLPFAVERTTFHARAVEYGLIAAARFLTHGGH